MTHIWWYTARAGGLVAWLLLEASVVFGLLRSTRMAGRSATPAWLENVHNFLGGLAVMFVGVHILGIVADSYIHFGVADVLVPFATSWHPLAVAWGIVVFWVLMAVWLTSLAKDHLPLSRVARRAPRELRDVDQGDRAHAESGIRRRHGRRAPHGGIGNGIGRAAHPRRARPPRPQAEEGGIEHRAAGPVSRAPVRGARPTRGRRRHRRRPGRLRPNR